MYTITSDFKHFITLDDKDEACALANSIKGGVYLFPNGEAVCVYSYKD